MQNQSKRETQDIEPFSIERRRQFRIYIYKSSVKFMILMYNLRVVVF